MYKIVRKQEIELTFQLAYQQVANVPLKNNTQREITKLFAVKILQTPASQTNQRYR